MYTTISTPQEKENERNSLVTSFVLHLFLLLLVLLLPFNTSEKPLAEEFQGILVSFGSPDAGIESSVLNEPIAASANVIAPEKKETTQEVKKTEAPKETSQAAVAIESETTVEESETIASKDVKKETPKKEIKEEAVEQSQSTASTATDSQESKADANAMAETKAKFGSLFGAGSPGNEENQKGDEFGQPDSSILEGMSKGKGQTGEGLNDRGIVFEPNIQDNSQKRGKVVIKVCVNADGDVISAKYTQRGSTTTDQYLTDLAVKNAKKYKFTQSSIPEQCGTIAIDFIVQ